MDAVVADTIENPVTGEHVRFLPRDAHSDVLAMEFTIAPHGFVAAPHVHGAHESFQVEAGTITFRVNGRDQTLGTGGAVSVPPGTPHVWWNPSSERARVRVELRPALRMESFFRQWFGLARDGKVNRRGMPNPLQLAATMHEYEREIRPPHIAQRAALSALAPVARLLGYRGRYARYERPGGPGDSP